MKLLSCSRHSRNEDQSNKEALSLHALKVLHVRKLATEHI